MRAKLSIRPLLRQASKSETRGRPFGERLAPTFAADVARGVTMGFMAIPATLPRIRGQHRNRAPAAARAARAVDLRTAGWTYQRIADQLGYANRGAVHNIVAADLKACTTEAVDTLPHLESGAGWTPSSRPLWAKAI